MLLKVQFVTKAWLDIRRKLENMEDWQEKGINELLREALKVYLWREEEKAKTKSRIMVGVAEESIRIDKEKSGPSSQEDSGAVKPWRRYPEKLERPGAECCFYCGETGHFKRNCK